MPTMSPTLSPLSELPRDRAASVMRRQIRRGVWRTGDRLPSERQLQEAIGVSRETIRSAIARLQDEGLLDRIKYRGCVIAQGAASESVPPEGLISKSVLMAVLDEGEEELQPHSSSGQISQGVFREVRRLGLHAVLLSTDRMTGDALEASLSSRPYGLVVAERQAERLALPQIADRLSVVGVRLAQVGGNPEHASWPVAVSDHRLGGSLAAWALVERDCDRLMWVGTPPLSRHWVRQRLSAAESVCREAGLLEPARICVRGLVGRAKDEASFDSLARAFAGHLIDTLGVRSSPVNPGSRPGLLAANDIDAALTQRACRHLGWTPGKDVLVAGYDAQYLNLPEREWESKPPAVTVDKRNADLGVTAVELLGDESLTTDPPVRTLEPRLVTFD